MDPSASVHVPRTVLPAMAEATAYDLLKRYFGSHSHKPRQGDARAGTARPPSRGTTAATAATGATESGGSGSSGGHKSSSSSRHRESVRWRHSCTALWPLGVAAALGSLMSATSSEGAEEIGESLGVKAGHARRSFPAIAKDAENMLKDLTSTTRSQDGVMIEAATLFGVPPDVSLSSTFMHSLLHRFATDAKHLQDAAALDLWVSTATNGRVTSLLKDLPSAFAAHMADPSRPVPILLASVLHFTGHWAPSNEFDPACTTRDTFKLARGTTSGCYMMRALGDIRHVRCPNFQAVGLDFGPEEVYPGGIGHRFCFVALLPNQGLDVEDVLRAFSPTAWPELQKVMAKKRGLVRLPRLDASSFVSLHAKDMLGATGMGAIFEASVAFDKALTSEAVAATGDLMRVTAVIQRVVIKLDETTAKGQAAPQGTPGFRGQFGGYKSPDFNAEASKTRYGSNPTHSPAPSQPPSSHGSPGAAIPDDDASLVFKLKFDRPFAFAIVDKLEARAVVMGEVQKPGQPGRDPGSRRSQATKEMQRSRGTTASAPELGRPATGSGAAGGWGGAAGDHAEQGSVLGAWNGSRTGHGAPQGGGAAASAQTGYLTSAGPQMAGTLNQGERVHTAWVVGTPVEVSFGGTAARARSHRATIAAVNPDGSYDVRWTDSGEVHKFVSRNFIRAVSAVGALPATNTGMLTAAGRAPTSHTASGDNYAVGMGVEVSYDRGRSWKKGHVAHVHSNGTLDIVHDDAATDIEHGVPMEFVRPRGRGASRSGGVAMNGARRRSSGATHLRPVGAKAPSLGDPVEVDDKKRGTVHLGRVVSVNRDGTYDVVCGEKGDLVTNLAPDSVRPATGSTRNAQPAATGHVSNSLSPADQRTRRRSASGEPASSSGGAPRPVFHEGITCMMCRRGPIKGIRYKCSVCPTIDFCESCVSSSSYNHNERHLLLRVPDSRLSYAPPSSMCVPVPTPASAARPAAVRGGHNSLAPVASAGASVSAGGGKFCGGCGGKFADGAKFCAGCGKSRAL